MINNRFLFYKTKDAFERDKNEIMNESIVFIADPAIIWTHGIYYVANKNSETQKHIFTT